MRADLAMPANARKYLILGCSCLLSLATGGEAFEFDLDAWILGQSRDSALFQPELGTASTWSLLTMPDVISAFWDTGTESEAACPTVKPQLGAPHFRIAEPKG
jgi:hypothetical protein